MAANSKDRKLAQSFKTRLEKLSCPFVEGVDESWVLELVFRPGEPRVRLLQWLFSRFDSKLNDVLDPHYAPVDMKMDSRIQRLVFVASALGLCKPENVDLIRGTTSLGKQVMFMDQLVDLVVIMDAADDPQTKAMQSPGHVTSAMTLEEQFSKDCYFVDSLASQEQLDDIFSTQAKLLPPDIMKKIESSRAERGCNMGDKIVLPEISALEEKNAQLEKNLKKQSEILEEITKLHKYPEPDVARDAKVSRTLKLVLSELSQLLVGFSYSFENEMRPWCNRTPPNLGEQGPAFKRVHSHLQIFSSLLKSLMSIRSSHAHLCTKMKDDISHITSKQTNSPRGVSQQLQEFDECVNILEESIARLESTIHATPNTTFSSSIVKI